MLGWSLRRSSERSSVTRLSREGAEASLGFNAFNLPISEQLARCFLFQVPPRQARDQTQFLPIAAPPCFMLQRPVFIRQHRAQRDRLRLHANADIVVFPRRLRRALKPLAFQTEPGGEFVQLLDGVRPQMAHDHSAKAMTDIVDVNGHERCRIPRMASGRGGVVPDGEQPHHNFSA